MQLSPTEVRLSDIQIRLPSNQFGADETQRPGVVSSLSRDFTLGEVSQPATAAGSVEHLGKSVEI